MKDRALFFRNGSHRCELFVVSMQLFLMRSFRDPIWGDFVSRSDLLKSDGKLCIGMGEHLEQARKNGVLTYDSFEAALTFSVGVLRESMKASSRNILLSEDGHTSTIRMVLLGLRLSNNQATKELEISSEYISRTAPTNLDWWPNATGEYPFHFAL